MKTVKETLKSDGYYDQVLDTHLVSVMAGDYHWTKSSEIAFSTTLGSCLSVCAYDKHAGIGGINHFLLPEAPAHEGEKYSQSFRYGSAAIESMLNALYSKGAAKNGLSIKIFGGSKVIKGMSQDIGNKNINFTRSFFTRENLRIESEDVGGSQGRRIIFFPRTGKVLMKKLADQGELSKIAEQEKKILNRLSTTESSGDVELF